MEIKKKYVWAIAITGIIIGIVGLLNPFSTLMARDEAEGRVAFVDVQKVFELHPDKTSAEKQLNEAAQSMQSELETKANDLSQEKQQSLLQEYQSKLSEREQKLIQNVLQQIEEAIKTVAEKKGVKLVLDKRNVIYGGYDMTQDVVDYINSQNEAEDKSAESTENDADSDNNGDQ